MTQSEIAVDYAKNAVLDMVQTVHHDDWPDAIDGIVSSLVYGFEASESWAEGTVNMFLARFA